MEEKCARAGSGSLGLTGKKKAEKLKAESGFFVAMAARIPCRADKEAATKARFLLLERGERRAKELPEIRRHVRGCLTAAELS